VLELALRRESKLGGRELDSGGLAEAGSSRDRFTVDEG